MPSYYVTIAQTREVYLLVTAADPAAAVAEAEAAYAPESYGEDDWTVMDTEFNRPEDLEPVEDEDVSSGPASPTDAEALAETCRPGWPCEARCPGRPALGRTRDIDHVGEHVACTATAVVAPWTTGDSNERRDGGRS